MLRCQIIEVNIQLICITFCYGSLKNIFLFIPVVYQLGYGFNYENIITSENLFIPETRWASIKGCRFISIRYKGRSELGLTMIYVCLYKSFLIDPNPKKEDSIFYKGQKMERIFL